MNEIYLSIVIPMRNQEKYIARCLDSIVTQSMFEQSEVIVVDDGSTDSGAEIVKKYMLEYGGQIKLITQLNKGPGGARNTGARIARGYYIWFVDGDDAIKEDAIALLYKASLSDKPEIIMFDMDEVDADGEQIIYSRTYDGNVTNKIFSPEDHKDILGSIHSASNRIILREFYQNVQIDFPDKLYFEDLMTIPKILCQTKRILYVRSSYYNYYHNEGSIMRSSNTEKYRDVVAVMDNLLGYFIDTGLMHIYKDEFEYMIIYHAYLMVSARIIKQDRKSAGLKEIKSYVKSKWPKYHKNVYIKRLNIKHKISLRCIDYGFYWPIYYVLNRKGKRDV